MKIIVYIGFTLLFSCLSIHKVNNLQVENSKTESKNIFVYDYESIFLKTEKELLEKKILGLFKESKKKILIVTTHSIGKYKNIEEYATVLRGVYSDYDENENIIVIVLSKKLNIVRISTSKKAKRSITNLVSREIIDEMIPEFIKESYFIGIEKGLDRLIIKWSN